MSRKGQKVALDWDAPNLSAGEEPAWASFDYLKLRETLETIVAAMEASAQDVAEDADSPPAAKLQLVVSNDEPGSADLPVVEGPEKPAA